MRLIAQNLAEAELHADRMSPMGPAQTVAAQCVPDIVAHVLIVHSLTREIFS
jgi:hypothetical protein